MSVIDDYLAELAGELRVSRKAKERIVAEAEDHLCADVTRSEARGVSHQAAENDAVGSLGTPVDFAAGFFEEQATRAVKRLALITAITGLALFPLAMALPLDFDPPGPDLWATSAAFSGTVLGLLLRTRRASALSWRDLSGLLVGPAMLFAVALFGIVQTYAMSDPEALATAMALISAVFVLITVALLPGTLRLCWQVRSLERSRAAAGHPDLAA